MSSIGTTRFRVAAPLNLSRLLIRSFSTGTGNRHQYTTTSTSPSFPKPEFYVPRHERGKTNRNLFKIDYMVGETRLVRNDRLCPTRELYFGPVQWGRHKSPYRKFRHMINLFRAAPFQRLLFPDLFCLTFVASGLTYYNEFVATSTEGLSTVSMSPAAFAGATTAIGLLAGFRLNNSYGRYREGRKIWSDAQSSVRDLARQTKMWVADPESQTRLLRLCQAFPVTLMFHLNGKGSHHNMKRLSRLGDKQFKDRVFAEFRAELYDVYNPVDKDGDSSNDMYDCSKSETIENEVLRDDFERLCHAKLEEDSVPLEVLMCMSETIAGLDKTNLDIILVRELEQNVQHLTKSLGGGERILKTPLPTGFARHSSRLLFIWSNCLPFALFPVMGPLGTLPTSLLTSYAILGIEDISVQLEEPFDVLPLRQMSDTMYDSVTAIEKGYRSPRVAAAMDGN